MSDTADSSVDFGAIASAVTERLNASVDEVSTPSSDAPDAGTATPAVADAPVADALAATGAEADVEVDPFDDDKVQTFDRDYVEKLRDKEARYRIERNETQERWAEWDKTLEGLNPDQQGLARELVASILQGDLARATEIIGVDALAEVLNVKPAEVAAATATVDPAAPDAPLTRAEFERELAKREADKQKNAEIDAVYTQAKGLGYNPEAKPGTPEFGEWVMLVQHAEAAGSLEAGHKAMEAAKAAERQRIIDEYVASRNGGSPAPANASGAAAREPEDAWLDKEGGNPLQASYRRAMERMQGDRTQVG